MKKLTIEEYKEKLVEAKQKAYGILADDSKEHTFYVLHEKDGDGNNLFHGAFNNWKKLQHRIDELIFEYADFWEENYCFIKKNLWFEVNKYSVVDGELKEILICILDSEGKILKFWLCDKNLNLQKPLCKDVEKLFENGDVIEVTQAPLEGVYYGIYLYNKNDENPHSILTYGCSGYNCFGIKNLDEISKVKKCPEDKINILSENIKKRKGDYIKVFKEERINVSHLPF